MSFPGSLYDGGLDGGSGALQTEGKVSERTTMVLATDVQIVVVVLVFGFFNSETVHILKSCGKYLQCHSGLPA